VDYNVINHRDGYLDLLVNQGTVPVIDDLLVNQGTVPVIDDLLVNQGTVPVID